MVKKAIEVIEYAYVLHRYDATIEITLEEYEKLKNGSVDISELMDKYEAEYEGCSEPIYDDCYTDSYEWEE